MLKDSGKIQNLSLDEVRTSTKENCKHLIRAIEKVLRTSLFSSCQIISIDNGDELKTVIHKEYSKVSTYKKEVPDNKLQVREEPKELKYFSYEKLKQTAVKTDNIYRGKLYGTIESYKCSTKIECPSCDGSGICSKCQGNRQITCTVCNGSQECPSCYGTGKYGCENCNGTGNCPDCDGDGECDCETCWGDGRISCPDCHGTGNYIEDTCNKCGGSGDYYGRICRACDGTGTYTVTCKLCDGEGEIECPDCDGDGTYTCDTCHGSGDCTHCYGKGYLPCKACKSSGVCGKCHGKGMIWCPECQGKGKCFDCKGYKYVQCPRCEGLGIYQSFIEYSIEETEKGVYDHFSLPVPYSTIMGITGTPIFDGVVYSFFAGIAQIYDDKSAIKKIPSHCMEQFRDWIKLENFSTFSSKWVNDDYLKLTLHNDLIPVTTLKYSCRKKIYSIYIIGKEKVVCYDQIPSRIDSFIGRFTKLFSL